MTFQSTRRAALSAMAIALCPHSQRAALAQPSTFPTGPVRIVMPFPPGTSLDVLVRLVGERLMVVWKQPVVIESRPGASSMIASTAVAQAKPDGHVLLGNVLLILQNPLLRSKLPYDPAALVPLMQLQTQQLPLLMRSDLGFASAKDLLEYARTHPGKLNFATYGIGSTPHIIKTKIELDQKVSMTHVPYQGPQDVIKALLTGDADIGMTDYLPAKEHVASGKLKVIAVTGARRMARAADAPTFAELGVSGFEGALWFGLFAPAGTPEAVQSRIAADIAAVMADPSLQQKLRNEMFVEPAVEGPEAFRKTYDRDYETWAATIRKTKIALD